MSLFSSEKIGRIFLSKHSVFEIEQKVDVILSPEFYWIRVFEIPVKTEKEALEVVPTLFEDVHSFSEFSYKVINISHNKFMVFAYSNSEIIEFIKKANLSLSQIRLVYFAQTELKDFQDFSIFNDSYSYSDDGILLKLPNSLKQECTSIEDKISTLKLSNNNIDIKFYSNILDLKHLYKFSFLFIFFILMNLFRYFVYDKNIEGTYTEIDRIKKTYNMPKTMIQTNSIIEKLKRRVENEVKTRDALGHIFDFKSVIPKGTINKISFKNKIIIIDFINTDSSQIRNYLESKYGVIRDINKNNLTRIEIKL